MKSINSVLQHSKKKRVGLQIFLKSLKTFLQQKLTLGTLFFSFSYINRSKSPTHTSHKLSSRQKISKGSQLSFIFENNPASKVADMPAQLPKFKVVDISKHQLLVSHDGPSEKSPEYVSLTFVDQV